MRFLKIFSGFMLFFGVLNAQSSSIVSGTEQKPVSLDQSLALVVPGSIVVLGENHGFEPHRDQQITIIQNLIDRGFTVSVGMEFFTYTHQTRVDEYLSGQTTEVDFLKQISWGSTPFDFYRQQVLAPLKTGGWTWALNAPRELTAKVAKTGIESLTPPEQALLPPNFTLGRQSYRDRFMALMPHLPEGPAADRYFSAQSIWDDTMAWRASRFMAVNPSHVLVIIVGEFHVAWGGGLIDRLKQRSANPVLSFTLLNTSHYSPVELVKELLPDASGEVRADYIWLSAAP